MRVRDNTLKIAGAIAGIIVVLGILVIGAQYASNLAGGASAQVMSLESLPPVISVSKEEITELVSHLDRYWAAGSLAEKNQVVRDLEVLVSGLVGQK